MVRVEEAGAVVRVRHPGGYRLLFLAVVAVAVGGEGRAGGGASAARSCPSPSHMGVGAAFQDVSIITALNQYDK